MAWTIRPVNHKENIQFIAEQIKIIVFLYQSKNILLNVESLWSRQKLKGSETRCFQSFCKTERNIAFDFVHGRECGGRKAMVRCEGRDKAGGKVAVVIRDLGGLSGHWRRVRQDKSCCGGHCGGDTDQVKRRVRIDGSKDVGNSGGSEVVVGGRCGVFLVHGEEADKSKQRKWRRKYRRIGDVGEAVIRGCCREWKSMRVGYECAGSGGAGGAGVREFRGECRNLFGKKWRVKQEKTQSRQEIIQNLFTSGNSKEWITLSYPPTVFISTAGDVVSIYLSIYIDRVQISRKAKSFKSIRAEYSESLSGFLLPVIQFFWSENQNNLMETKGKLSVHQLHGQDNLDGDFVTEVQSTPYRDFIEKVASEFKDIFDSASPLIWDVTKNGTCSFIGLTLFLLCLRKTSLLVCSSKWKTQGLWRVEPLHQPKEIKYLLSVVATQKAFSSRHRFHGTSNNPNHEVSPRFFNYLFNFVHLFLGLQPIHPNKTFFFSLATDDCVKIYRNLGKPGVLINSLPAFCHYLSLKSKNKRQSSSSCSTNKMGKILLEILADKKKQLALPLIQMNFLEYFKDEKIDCFELLKYKNITHEHMSKLGLRDGIIAQLRDNISWYNLFFHHISHYQKKEKEKENLERMYHYIVIVLWIYYLISLLKYKPTNEPHYKRRELKKRNLIDPSEMYYKLFEKDFYTIPTVLIGTSGKGECPSVCHSSRSQYKLSLV
ncbi:hypothetical protein VP01_656g3 [Puccinia sorghi]|uniref:Uncharacterized protein n=1 Tax=Puccinia sorghi TaxID=27349 RepID=A0A0L6UHG8_9BASI|nr:hypothetical protein VP01_656g3 [Puccinia sorghi]